MKHLFKNKSILTRNRQMILLNFFLLCLITILSGLIFDSLFAAFIGGITSSIVLRLIFAWRNPRDFGPNPTITASNGLLFTKKHKYLLVSVMIVAAIGSWFLGILFKSPRFNDFLPHLIAIFSFQLSVKSLLFFLDLPIGTFSENQNNVRRHRSFNSSPSYRIDSSSDFVTSPTYRYIPGNIHKNKWN